MNRITSLLTKKTIIVLASASFVGLFALLVFIGYYANPYSDDYYYALALRNHHYDFWATQKWYFYTWFGRVTSNVFITLFSYNSFEQYFSAIIANLLLYLFAVFFFCHVVFKGLPFWKSILLGAFVFLYTLYTLPSIQESVFWLSGFGNYQIANSFTLIAAAFLMKMVKTKHWLYTVLVSVFLFMAVTSNEISAVTIVVALFIPFAFWAMNGQLDKQLLTVLVVALVGFCIIVFAPGNGARLHAEHYALGKQDVFRSFHKSLVFVFFQVAEWLFYTPLLVVTALYMIVFGRSKWHLPLWCNIKTTYILAMLFLGMFAANFAVLWGLNLEADFRKLNVMYSFFLFCWFLVINRFAPKIQRIVPPFHSEYSIRWIAMTALVLLLTLPNVFLAIKDVRGMGSVFVYNRLAKERDSELQYAKGSHLYIMKRIDKMYIPNMYSYHNEVKYYSHLLNKPLREYYQIDTLVADRCWDE
jgi:hypothetical protein